MKNPYEMRYEYYRSAKEQLLEEYHAKITEMQIADRKDDFPKYPTTDDIIALAERIKTFTEKK